jgi:gluconokinase
MAPGSGGAWYLGIDIGTGSCKSVAIDPAGVVLGLGASAYEQAGTDRGWKEQDPQALVVAMVTSARAAIEQAQVSGSACQGLSLGGAYHSLMAVDRSGRPLTGVSTWVDDRATSQAAAVRQAGHAQALYRQTGCPVHSMYPLYKLIWLRESQPETFQRAARFISGKEYVYERLTGEPLVDFGIAAGSALLNTHSLDWNPLSLDLAGIEPARLSILCDPTHVIDRLNPELAAEMGIPATTRLVAGSADAVNSSLGAGATVPGTATCMIGTSGAFRIVAAEPLLDPQARSWCYAIDPGHWLVGGAINNGGLSLSWWRSVLNQALILAGEGSQIPFEELVALASEADPGAGGLICLPFFAGERSPYWNMNARAVFFGMSLQHDLRHLTRALLEGVAYRLRSVQEVLVELGAHIHQVMASGGFTQSHTWPQILADVLQSTLLVPESGETSSLGAAYWALLGTGQVQTIADLHTLVRVGQRYEPDPRAAAVYDTQYPLYQELYAVLRPAFEKIARPKSGSGGDP